MNSGTVILLSIKPKWYELIKSGKKKIEIRKRICTFADKMVLYVSAPVSKIMGEVEVEEVLDRPFIETKTKGIMTEEERFIEEYETLRDECCIETFEEFSKYIGGCEKKYYAIKVKNFKEYDKPKELSEYGVKKAPQNYQYLEQ